MKLEMIISELQEDADLNKILKRGWVCEEWLNDIM